MSRNCLCVTLPDKDLKALIGELVTTQISHISVVMGEVHGIYVGSMSLIYNLGNFGGEPGWLQCMWGVYKYIYICVCAQRKLVSKNGGSSWKGFCLA